MKIYLIALFSLLSILSNAQTSEYLTLEGKVVDSKTNRPLAFAHIGVPALGIGTTTSDKGIFRFKIPAAKINEDLTVSFIGYQTFRKKVERLGNPVTIKLQTSENELVEVEVLGQNAVENIIRKAVQRIPKNYPTSAHTDLAFYRESRTGKDSQYIYLAEGVLQVYKRSYKSSKEGQVSLVQGRKINLRNPLDTTISRGFSSGHMAAHRFDFVYNREDFLQEEFFPVYDYWIESMTTYNGNPVYIIAFNKDYDAPALERKKKKKRGGLLSRIRNGGNLGSTKIEARMKGRVYIDKKTYAIIRGEFEITPAGLKKYNDYPLYSGSWDGNSYLVNYQQIGERWYFSDAFRKGLYSGGGVYTNEVKITEINPEKSQPLPYLDRLTRNQSFTRMTGTYDPDFWANYNTTPMSTDLAASMEQLNNAKKAREALDPVYLAELQLRRDSIQYVKRQQELEEEKREANFDLSENQSPNWKKKPAKKRKKNFNRFSTSIGLGTHFIDTKKNQMSVAILTDETPRETIISVNEEVNARSLEVVGHIDLDFFYRKNLFVRLGSAFDFANSRYKERSVGLGLQMNLTPKRRPFLVRTMVQYSNFKYYRKVGMADNDFGKFKIEGEKFKANDIKVNYGSRTHNLKFSVDLSIERNPGREIYLRGTYFLPIDRRQDIWIQERKELFRKKTNIPVDNARVLVTQNDIPFNGQIMSDETFSVSIGFLFK